MSADSPRFRIAVLSQLAPRKTYATTGAPPLRAFRSDDGAIDGLLGQIPVGVKLEIADPLGASGSKLRVDLAFKGPKSFRPDGIVAQVPALRALGEVPARLAALARRKASRAEVVRELAQLLPSGAWAEALAPLDGGGGAASAPEAARSSGSATVDDILAHTETATAPKASAFSSLIAQVARGGAAAPIASSAAAGDRATRAFGAILSDILDHPEVRRLERVWRGLRYLLAQAPLSSTVEIEVVPLDETNLADALGYLVERPADVVPAPDLLVLDTELQLGETSLGALEVPALVAERLRAPLLVGVRADDRLDEEATTAALRAAGAAAWASWVVLALNGGLLRGPYTAEKLPVAWAQDPNAPGARAFASAPVLVAALVARAFAHGGWAGPITGPEAGVLAGFDVHGTVAGGATSVFATERLVTNEAAQRHARRGICALTSVPNRDSIACIAAPTLAAAAQDRAPTLADQLFVARIAGLVAALGAAIPAGTDPKSADEVAQIAFAELFPRHGSHVPFVETRVHDDTLEVIVTPRRFAGTTMGELSFEAPFGE